MVKNRDWKIFGGLTLFATVLLLLASNDSYLFDLFSRTDSAWFFMCGKAWMNGLVPYVDFTDSKGPLLWLIYGLGYLIDHTSYVGVYWISCLWYGLIYFFTFKLVEIFLKDTRKSLICTVLMSFAYFCPWFHLEVRAEDFSLLFMVVSLYHVCRMMYSGKTGDRDIRLACWVLGACFGCLLLIKFNLAVMQAAFILCALWVIIREKKNPIIPFIAGLGGFVAVTLPFIVCFLIQGNFSAFIEEYFVKTTQTVIAPDSSAFTVLLRYLVELCDISKPHIGGLLFLLIIGGVLFIRHEKGPYRWMPFLVSMFIFFITMSHHRIGWFEYYFNICSFLLVFLMMDLVSGYEGTVHKFLLPLTAVITIGVVSFLEFYSNTRYAFAFGNDEERYNYYRVSYVMSQVESPTMVDAYWLEQGFGMPSGVLPAGKYWVTQAGMTPEMMREHERLILSGKADFILAPVEKLLIDGNISPEQLAEIGYKECFRFDGFKEFALYTKRVGLDTDLPAAPTFKDILLKRTRYIDGQWR